MRKLGCHVSVAGGLENALKNAKELGVNAIQCHPSPPQRWNQSPFKEGAEAKFLELWDDSGVEAVFFHAIYLINLATPDKEKFEKAIVSLQNYLDLLGRINGAGVVVHVGSSKDWDDENEAFKHAASGINRVLEKAPANSKLLLEVAAGSGSIIGDKFEELSSIYELVSDKDRVGFALDSQHMWASGYDLENSLDETVSNLEEAFGLEKIGVIHLNDSKTELGSNRDRHENLGQGHLGEKTVKNFLNHPKLKNIPYVLETPALKDMESAKDEVKTLQSWAKE